MSIPSVLKQVRVVNGRGPAGAVDGHQDGKADDHLSGGDEVFGSKTLPFGIKSADESFGKMVEHLQANKIKLDGVKYRLGKKLTLDPTKECFVGHHACDWLLTREYRNGFVVPDKV